MKNAYVGDCFGKIESVRFLWHDKFRIFVETLTSCRVV